MVHRISTTCVFTAYTSCSLPEHNLRNHALGHILSLCSGVWEERKGSLYCGSVCATSCACLWQALTLVSIVSQQLCKVGIVNDTP